MRLLQKILWACGGCVWALVAQAATQVSGSVSWVTDGDSVWMTPNANSALPEAALKRGRLQLRLKDIDAPESCQAGGAQAAAALRQLLAGQPVRVELLHRDTYQRWLARLYLPRDGRDELDVAAWLVAQGHAWDYQYANLKPGRYAALQALAQEAGHGVWAQPGAIHPKHFRQQHGHCPTGQGLPSTKVKKNKAKKNKAKKNKAKKPKTKNSKPTH